jgi:uncharacterized protein
MAKAPDTPAPSAIRALINDKGLLQVHVTSNARQNLVLLPEAGAPAVLQVRTTATPENGKATKDVLKLVADALGLAKTAVTLERGATSRDKVLRIAPYRGDAAGR